MRTAKKTLCLVLAVAMMLSLGVFNVSADPKFTDAEDIQFTEAAEVLSTIGEPVTVIEGFEDGSFRPGEILTRAQGAAITARLMDWQDVPAITTFTDVPEWAHPYVAFCESNGIVAGYGDGTFGPDDELTGAQFAKMLLGALGYDPEVEKMQNVGTEWIVRVAQFARQNKLDDGIDNFPWNDPITREQAMQMALNAIKATMVEYTTAGSAVAGTANASYMTDTKAYARNISARTLTNGAYTVELGEYYFKDLELFENATDEFYRPADEWTYKGKEIGTYTEEPTLVYDGTKVETGDIHTDLALGKNTDVTDISLYEDGKEVENPGIIIARGEDDELGGRSSRVEVFYDDADSSAIIIVINTYYAEVVTVKAATSKADAKVAIDELFVGEVQQNAKTAFNANHGNPFGNTVIDDEYETEEFAKDDYVSYTYSLKEDSIQSMAKLDTVKGKLDSYKENSNVVVDGTKYEKARMCYFVGDIGDVGSTITVYIDAYGNLGYVDYDEEVNYAVLLAYDAGNSLDDARAKLLFPDGTTQVVALDDRLDLNEVAYNADTDTANSKLASEDRDGKFSKYDIVRYTTSGSKYVIEDADKYLLADSTYAYHYDADGSLLIKNGRTKLFGTNNTNKDYVYNTGEDTKAVIYADGDTTFIIDDDGTYKVYDGIANVPDIYLDEYEYVTVYVEKTGTSDIPRMATCVFMTVNTEDLGSYYANKGDAVIFVEGDKAKLEHYEDNDYYTYTAYQDGVELEEFKVSKKVHDDTWFAADTYTILYNPLYNDDGILTGLKGTMKETGVADPVDGFDDEFTGAGIGYSYKNGVVAVDASGEAYVYSLSDDAKAYIIDSEGNISEIDVDDIGENADNDVWWHLEDVDHIDVLYIVENESGSGSTTKAGKYTLRWIEEYSGALGIYVYPEATDISWTLYAFPVGGTIADAYEAASSDEYYADTEGGYVWMLSSTSPNVFYFADVTIGGRTYRTTTHVGGTTIYYTDYLE